MWTRRAVIDSLTGRKRFASALRSVIAQGERFLLPSLVPHEWQRGPGFAQELATQEALFPSDSALPFGALEHRSALDFVRCGF